MQHEEHNYLECTERNNWACPVENLHSDVKWCEMVFGCQASVYIQYVECVGYTIPAQGYKFVYEPSNLHAFSNLLRARSPLRSDVTPTITIRIPSFFSRKILRNKTQFVYKRIRSPSTRHSPPALANPDFFLSLDRPSIIKH